VPKFQILPSMKDIKVKITKYTTAVGALLAVAPAANSAPVRGTLTPGDDGNTTLTHHLDWVGIDINNDGSDEFVAYMYTDTSVASHNPFGATLIKEVAIYGYSGNSVDLSSSFGPSDLSSTTDGIFFSMVKKYFPGNKIGPLSSPNYDGLLGFYSNGHFSPDAPALSTPFGLSDEGFIGVSSGDFKKKAKPIAIDYNYGWIQVAVDNHSNFSFIDCAMESASNTPISAGSAVPILPVASAFGLGLAGLTAYLKGKKKKQ